MIFFHLRYHKKEDKLAILHFFKNKSHFEQIARILVPLQFASAAEEEGKGQLIHEGPQGGELFPSPQAKGTPISTMHFSRLEAGKLSLSQFALILSGQ